MSPYTIHKDTHDTYIHMIQMHMMIFGVAMGSPLGPVPANIFMVELERSLY